MKLFLYIFVMAMVTYLIRMIPFAFFSKKIKSRFFRSFLYYIPYAVLSAMTIPAIFYSTGNILSAAVGTAAAVLFWCTSYSCCTCSSTCGISDWFIYIILLKEFLL